MKINDTPHFLKQLPTLILLAPPFLWENLNPLFFSKILKTVADRSSK